MRAEKRQERMREIEGVAYEMLAELGYEGMSMLAVAKRARASNETMYRWYGDKNGLFASMIEANATKVSDRLAALQGEGLAARDTLRLLAPVLLEMLLSDAAIGLNRAAAADPSGVLGQAIADGGREKVLPLIRDVIDAAIHDGSLLVPEVGKLGTSFMHLLVGDQQIRRVIGALAEPSTQEILAQAEVALAQFFTLFGAAPEG